MFGRIEAGFGGVDILVNKAGIMQLSNIAATNVSLS